MRLVDHVRSIGTSAQSNRMVTSSTEAQAYPDNPSEVSTLLYNNFRNGWVPGLLRRMAVQTSQASNVNSYALRSCANWAANLPSGVPEPFFAIGDDGSLGLEWDRGGNYLYFLFTASSSEAYFEGDNGDQWEVDLGVAPDKLIHALRVISNV